MAISYLPQASDADFDQIVFADNSPVMVEFFAPWCGHCRKVAPAINEIANEYAGRLRVVQVNADQSVTLPSRFGIQGVPTMIILVSGEEVDRISGAVPKESIREHIDRALAPAAQRD